MTSPIALITGCSRGIGIGLVQAFHNEGYKVLATCRNPDKAAELADLLKKLGQPEALALDITDDGSIEALKNKVTTEYGKIDVLVNNAGVATANHPHDPLGQIQRSEMIKVLTTNVGSTAMVTQGLHPILGGPEGQKGKVIYISSFLGSISCNNPKETNFYMATSYRCSKAAINQLVKCFSLSSDTTYHLSVSPGHVQTDMGNAQGRTAPLTVDFVAGCIAKLPGKMTKENNGAFVDFQGETIPY